MKYYGIGKFAELTGVTIQSLRNWDANGKLKPHHYGKGGHRYYSQEQLNHYLGLRNIAPKNRKVVGYCRVSSKKQSDDLARQVENIRSYMCAKGYAFEIISDVGSGINYGKKGLRDLLTMVTSGEVEKIVVLYKDRLMRFGFELMEQICGKYGTTIEIVDQTEKTEEQELVEDLVQIITIFSCKLQGRRAHKAKKLVKELLVDD
jgi:predicted site-specific integrase-resolvase